MATGTNGPDTFVISTAPTDDYNGLGGTDTIELASPATNFDFSAHTLSSIERLVGDASSVLFTLNQNDIHNTTAGHQQSLTSIIDTGGNGTVELAFTETQLDLTSTTLSGISEITVGGGSSTMIVDLLDIQGVSVFGSSGTDTLEVKGTNFDLTSTTLSFLEELKSSSNAATRFTLDHGDLFGIAQFNGSIVGGTGKDTLLYADTDFDLHAVSLSSIEILKAGTTSATTFTVNQADLASGGSIMGSTNVGGDTIALASPDTALDLTSTTLSSIENLNGNTTAATAFTLDSADLNGLKEITGFQAGDTLTIKGTTIDLSHTELSGIDNLNSSGNSAVTFKMSEETLAFSATAHINGGSGTDTIIATESDLDLDVATLSSIEVLKTSDNAGTEFDIEGGAPGASLKSILGGSGTDELFMMGASNLTSTTLSSIEHIIGEVTIVLDQADLMKGGMVEGDGTTDLQINNPANLTVDLSQTSLSDINILSISNPNDGLQTFKLGANAAGGDRLAEIDANAATSDQIVATGTELDLTNTKLSSIELLSTSFAGGTEFVVTEAELTAFGSNISGSKGSDSLVLGEVGATQFDLTGMSGSLNSIENVGVNTGVAADILITHAELLKLKGFIGGDNGDTLAVTDSTDFNLTSATLDDINELIGTSVGTRGTTFTLDANDLGPSLGTFFSITGTAGALDTVAVKSTTIDLSGTNLSSIEVVKSTITNSAITFKVGPDTLDNSPAIAFDGNAGKNDTIQMVSDLTVDFSSATFSSIEILKYDTSTGDDIIIKDSFLAANGGSLGSVVAGDNNDVLEVAGTAVNFLSTTLTGIDQLQVNGTTITLDQTDILNGSKQTLEQIIDNANAPGTILQVKSAIIDLSQTELSGIEVIKAFGQAAATPITFKISENTLTDQPNGPVQFVGGGGTDTIQAVSFGTGVFDLTSADMSSIEVLKTDISSFTEIDIKDTVLAANAGGSVNLVIDRGVDNPMNGVDTLGVFGTSIDLTATTLSGIEVLTALATDDSTFTLDQTDLFAKSGTKITQELFDINGNTGNDTLAVKANTIDLSSVELSSVETIKAATGISGPITFIINNETISDDGGSTIVGNGAASDTVTVGFLSGETNMDLRSTDFSSIETLQVNASTANDYIVHINDLDLAGATNVLAHVVGAGAANAFITIDVADSGDIDLTSTTFSNIDELELDGGGHNLTIGTNTFQGPITVHISDTVEALHLGSNGGTSFDISQVHFDSDAAGFSGLTEDDGGNSVNVIVSQDNLNTLGTFNGTAQDDTLTAAGTQFDLLNSSAVLNSIEALATNNTAGTTFTVSQDHLDEMFTSASGGFGSVTGNSGNDTLIVALNAQTAIDLTSTTLSSIETLKAADSGFAILIDNVSNLGSLKTIDGDEGTFTLPGNGASLTLIGDSNFDLSHTSLSGIDILSGDSNGSGVTFTLDQADIFTTTKAGIIQQLTQIDGDGDTNVTDTILAHGTVLDLHGVTLSGIEDISADHSSGVKYTLDGNASGIDLDLMTGTGKNTVTLNAGYDGVIDNTSESTVLATTLTIDNFTHGQDTIDLSHVATNGTATFDSTAGAQGIADTAAGGGGDLHDILNALQNTYDGSTNSQVLKFEYNGDTYLMVDNAASGNTFDPADSVVKLSGTGLGVAASDLVVH